MAKEVKFYASRTMKSKFKSWKLLHSVTDSLDTYYDLDIMEAMEHYSDYGEKLAKKRIEAAIQEIIMPPELRRVIESAVQNIFKMCRTERRGRIGVLRGGISERHSAENDFSERKLHKDVISHRRH